MALLPPPPELEVPEWPGNELRQPGRVSAEEMVLIGLVLPALGLWIFGGSLIDPTTAALLVAGLLVVTRTIGWSDLLDDRPAFSTLIWFGTLVALAGGLAQTGVVAWLAGQVGPVLATLPPVAGLVGLIVLFFMLHYLSARVTAQVTALLMLTVTAKIPGLPMDKAALALCLTLGIMGIISPYGTGPSPVYAGSGFLPGADYWHLGAIFGGYNLLVFPLVGLPILIFLL